MLTEPAAVSVSCDVKSESAKSTIDISMFGAERCASFRVNQRRVVRLGHQADERVALNLAPVPHDGGRDGEARRRGRANRPKELQVGGRERSRKTLSWVSGSECPVLLPYGSSTAITSNWAVAGTGELDTNQALAQ